MTAKRSLILFIACAVLYLAPRLAVGQQLQAVSPADAAPAQPSAGRPAGVVVGPDGKPVMPNAKPGETPAKPTKPGEKPGKPDEKPGKPDEKKDGKKEDEAPKVLKRGDEPSTTADPKELDVHAVDGKVSFSFNGQKWDAVLQWLADESNMDLDWQELPGDYLNLTSPREYTIEEVRDVFNRHLLARGYTILVHEGALSVVKVAEINPAQVPRAEPGELKDRMPYEFVKVSFPLTLLVADQAAEEVKSMLSTNHKITPLRLTNRLEIMDAVINLREVHAMLEIEQSEVSQESLVEQFPLHYTRAEEVREQLLGILGMESKSSTSSQGSSSSSSQMRAMQQQMQAQMQQMQRQMQQRSSSAKSSAGGAQAEAKVTIIADSRRNMIIAHGPPDKLAVIRETIKLLDQSTGRIDSIEAYVARTQVYRLVSINPEHLAASLREMGGLDPRTRLTVDGDNNALIANATQLDHFSIRTLVDKLDGSGRTTYVVPLRRLRADLVAGSIDFLMGSGQKEEKSNNRYDYYSYRYGSRDDDKKTDQFRVTANIESNQLLLWANKIEHEQVLDLLTQLGEIRVRGGNGDIVRVIDSHSGPEMIRFLEELKGKWESLGDNELVLPSEDELQKFMPQREQGADEKPSTEEQPPLDRETRRTPQDESDPVAANRPVSPSSSIVQLKLSGPATARVRQARPTIQVLTGLPSDGADSSDQADAADNGIDAPRDRFVPGGRLAPDRPKISISVDPEGRLVISSRDTAALDRLEELMAQLAPPRRDFKVFFLKSAPAYWVKLNLEDFFEETDTGESNSDDNYFRGWYGYPPSTSKKDPSMLLSKRPPLKFIDDLDTNSILVKNASPDQLKIISELIELYDVPEPENTQAARVTRLFPVRFSKAGIIAETIKDAYRDLLSSNDKSLQGNKQQQENQRPGAGTTYISNYGGGKEDEPEKRTRITFKGKLSIGVDEYTNTLLVSAEGESLMTVIGNMIKDLDDAARPVGKRQVVRLGGNLNAANLKEVLTNILAEKQRQPQQPGQRDQRGQPGQPNQQGQQRFNGAQGGVLQPAQ